MNKMCLSLVLLGVLAAGLPVTAQVVSEIIVDNKDAEFEGAWQPSANARDKFREDYRFLSTTLNTEPTGTATFRPRVPTTGRYHVEIWYAAGEFRATNAPWLINFQGSRETVFVNQRKNGGRWLRIGADKPFNAGNAGFVSVGNNTGNTGAVVVADAIRLVRSDGSQITDIVPEDTSAPAETGGNSGKRNYSLNIRSYGGGSVTRTPDMPAYPGNTPVTITATPQPGFVFAGWSEDGKYESAEHRLYHNPLRLVLNENRSLQPHFIPPPTGIVIDDMDKEVEWKGEWFTFTREPNKEWPGMRESTFRYSPVKPKADSLATFRPEFSQAGRYDIYAWHTQGGNRSGQAAWSVSSKSGLVTTNIDQRINGGKWVLLAGGVEMEAGRKPNQFVRLSNNADATNAVVVADGVAFVFIGQ